MPCHTMHTGNRWAPSNRLHGGGCIDAAAPTPRRARSGILLALALGLVLPALPVGAHAPDAATTTVADAQLGRLDFPTSTRVPAAQAAFVRGMLWLHVFEYAHAADAFRQAEKLDPDFALAYWGEAMTHTHALWNQDDAAGGRAVLARLGPTPAARAAKAPTAREKAFLDTGEQLFGPGTLPQRDARFLAATKALAARYPHDDEAQLLYALALLGISRGDRNIPNYLQAAAISRKVLAHNPDHPGAAHYWIHGMDDPAHAAGALQAARALARIAPGAGHAQHMASHIYMALGDWDEVITANQRAMEVVAAQTYAQGKPTASCFHYDEWLEYADFQAGRMQAGQQLLAQCMQSGAATLAQMLAAPDRAVAGIAAYQGRWQSSLARMRATAIVESARDAGRDAALSITRADGDREAGWDVFADGYAALQGGKLDKARQAATKLAALAAQPITADDDPHTGDYLRILSDMLSGAIAVHDGQADAGIERVRAAAARYEALPYDFGPPVPVKPPRELAGELLLGVQRPKQALVEFDLSLKTNPRRAQSLLGRARALQASGDAVSAKQAYADLLAMWAHADPDLPELAEVRAGAGTVNR